MDWDRLRVFHAVAEAGSITHAGETLHLSQPAVSRQIRSLEAAMGATLFHRHPRGLLLTSEGEILFEATQEITAQLDASTVRLRDNREGVHGPLRVTTTLGFGIRWLTPRLPKLLEAHPGLSIELMLTEEILDLPMRQADVAIRMRAPRQADVIGRAAIGRRPRKSRFDYLQRQGATAVIRGGLAQSRRFERPNVTPSVDRQHAIRCFRGGKARRRHWNHARIFGGPFRIAYSIIAG